MVKLPKFELSSSEVKLLRAVPSHTLVAATTFLDAVTYAGMTWLQGKSVLSSLLEKELIVDLNADTLEDDHGVCDRTPLGDLALGIFISIRKTKGGEFEITNPPTNHEYLDGLHQGSVYDATSFEKAVEVAKNLFVCGAAIVHFDTENVASVIGYKRTSQEHYRATGAPAFNVSWDWEKLEQALTNRAA